mmetsp:Transcript_17551/g.29082  ORF Transcript_17551/g.29082 Transcript_17551/m.29082 type:complete len:91 (-) Transcript_17551:61-333(-)
MIPIPMWTTLGCTYRPVDLILFHICTSLPTNTFFPIPSHPIHADHHEYKLQCISLFVPCLGVHILRTMDWIGLYRTKAQIELEASHPPAI